MVSYISLFLMHSSLAQYKGVRGSDFTRAIVNTIPTMCMWNVLVFHTKVAVNGSCRTIGYDGQDKPGHL